MVPHKVTMKWIGLDDFRQSVANFVLKKKNLPERIRQETRLAGLQICSGSSRVMAKILIGIRLIQVFSLCNIQAVNLLKTD